MRRSSLGSRRVETPDPETSVLFGTSSVDGGVGPQAVVHREGLTL